MYPSYSSSRIKFISKIVVHIAVSTSAQKIVVQIAVSTSAQDFSCAFVDFVVYFLEVVLLYVGQKRFFGLRLNVEHERTRQ